MQEFIFQNNTKYPTIKRQKKITSAIARTAVLLSVFVAVGVIFTMLVVCCFVLKCPIFGDCKFDPKSAFWKSPDLLAIVRPQRGYLVGELLDLRDLRVVLVDSYATRTSQNEDGGAITLVAVAH